MHFALISPLPNGRRIRLFRTAEEVLNNISTMQDLMVKIPQNGPIPTGAELAELVDSLPQIRLDKLLRTRK